MVWIEIFNEVEAKSAIVALGGAESWYPDMTLLSSVDDRTYIDSVRHHRQRRTLRLAIADAGPNPDAALEATYGRNWAADVLEAKARPCISRILSAVNAFSYQPTPFTSGFV